MTAAFENAVVELETATAQLRATVKSRVQGGALIRLDGKKPCTAGKWGNNYGATRDTQLDPGWCSRDRDRNLPPVLRLPVACANLDQLFWPDVYAAAQIALRKAIANVPAHTDPWQLRAAWTRRVMELVSMALEATNIQPIFMFPSKWATEQPYLAFGDNELKAWGLPTSGWTFDGRREGWTQDTQTNRLLGYCVPREIHEFLYDWWFRATQGVPKQQELRNPFEGIWRQYGVKHGGSLAVGVHWGRESPGYEALRYLPAMMVGSLIADGSQTIRALKGEHDSWSSGGFPEQDPEELYPAKLPMLPIETLIVMLDRERVMANDMDAILRKELNFRGVPFEVYMNALFSTTVGPAAWVKAKSPRITEPSPWGLGAFVGLVPNAQWYVELALAWARVITTRSMADIVTDSTLFWLVNHHTYFKRMYGDALKLSSDEIADLAAAIAASRGTLLKAGGMLGTQIVNILSPIAGSVMGQVANMVTDSIVQYLSAPELPKPLFRRVSQNAACDISRGGEQAAWETTARDLLNRQSAPGAGPPAQDQEILRLILASQGRSMMSKPLVIGAGVALAAVGGALLWKFLK